MTSTRSIFPVIDTGILLVLSQRVRPVRCFRGPLQLERSFLYPTIFLLSWPTPIFHCCLYLARCLYSPSGRCRKRSWARSYSDPGFTHLPASEALAPACSQRLG